MSDVFPPRDLPDESESWGREVESTEDLLNAGQGRRSSQTKALNRSLASTSQSLSERLQRLSEGSSFSVDTQYLFGDAFPGFFEPWFITGPSWARVGVVSVTTFESPGFDSAAGGSMNFSHCNKAGSPPTYFREGASSFGEINPFGGILYYSGAVTLALDSSREIYTSIYGEYSDPGGAEITTRIFYQWF